MIQNSDNSLKLNATTFAILIRNLEYNAPTVLILRLNLKDFTTMGYVALIAKVSSFMALIIIPVLYFPLYRLIFFIMTASPLQL